MTDWAALRADIRVDLKDTGTTPRFTDAALHLWVKDAVRDYSMHFPYRIDRLALTPTGGAYSLPAGYYQDVEVECPLNSFLERRQHRPGQSYSEGSTPTTYYISGGKIYLDISSPTDTIYLTYDAIHASPPGPSDTAFVFTVPVADEELLRLYVKGKASEQLRTQQASLDRFKLGSGDRQDNPLLPEVSDTMQEYRRKLAERYPGKAIRFWKPRRT